MAKKAAKKTAKKTVAKKSAPAKGSKKTAPAREEEQIEIHLDEVEQDALDLVSTSDSLCNDLEKAVTKAVAKAVADVYKKHKIALNAKQAENVALLLFGNG